MSEELDDLICNPIYVGIGPYAPIVDRQTWILAACKAMAEVGHVAFFERMFNALDQAFGQAIAFASQEQDVQVDERTANAHCEACADPVFCPSCAEDVESRAVEQYTAPATTLQEAARIIKKVTRQMTEGFRGPIAADGYPEGWPRCAAGCGRPRLDGHLTCGDAVCGPEMRWR